MRGERSIILIGMPASGKSTIGLLLAKTICAGFIDTDILIQQNCNMTLQKYIDKFGLESFIRKESEIICSLPESIPFSVIATGGSAVMNEDAMKHLKKLGLCIFLNVPLPEIQRRLNNIHTRGIVMRENQSLSDIYREREPLYKMFSDIVIDADCSSPEALVDSLMAETGIEKCEQ